MLNHGQDGIYQVRGYVRQPSTTDSTRGRAAPGQHENATTISCLLALLALKELYDPVIADPEVRMLSPGPRASEVSVAECYDLI